MPYEINKKGGDFCVFKDTGESVPGGCHSTRAEAVDHMQALYASEAMAAVVKSFTNKEKDSVDEVVSLVEDEYEEYAIADNETVWQGPIAFENECTGDNRCFAEGAVQWDNDSLPLPLLWQKSSTDGHSGSVVIGRVDEIKRDGDTIFARGVILDTGEAQEYKALVQSGAAGGVSIDGDSAQYSVEEVDGGKSRVNFQSIRVRGLTAVSIPAFSGAKITFAEDLEEVDSEVEAFRKKKRKKKKGYTWSWQEDALTAAAPIKPPSSWFQNPGLNGPTPLTIDEDGRVFGYLATWNVCHIGLPNCVTPPKSRSKYAFFHTGALETVEGDTISVGKLTFNTGHAAMAANANDAAFHYDHTGAVFADVVAGEDEFGIWVSGAVRPHLSDEELRTVKAAPLSGDWRKIGGGLELVGALSVNVPGFPIPRNERAKVLTASGVDQSFILTLPTESLDRAGREALKQSLVDKVSKRDEKE